MSSNPEGLGTHVAFTPSVQGLATRTRIGRWLRIGAASRQLWADQRGLAFGEYALLLTTVCIAVFLLLWGLAPQIVARWGGQRAVLYQTEP